MGDAKHLGPEPPRVILSTHQANKQRTKTVTVWSASRARVRVESFPRADGSTVMRSFHFHRGAWRLVLPWHVVTCKAESDAVRAKHVDAVGETIAFLLLGSNQ